MQYVPVISLGIFDFGISTSRRCVAENIVVRAELPVGAGDSSSCPRPGVFNNFSSPSIESSHTRCVLLHQVIACITFQLLIVFPSVYCVFPSMFLAFSLVYTSVCIEIKTKVAR